MLIYGGNHICELSHIRNSQRGGVIERRLAWCWSN